MSKNNTFFKALGLIILVALTFSACQKPGQGNQNPENKNLEPIPFTPYAIEDSSKLDTLGNGLIIYEVEKGRGSIPPQGSHVLVHYYGTLDNGEKFDSSYERGEPLGFNVGKGQVIKGWDEGIALLKGGDKAVLFIPSELGYGKGGSGSKIPGDSELIFYIEAL